MAPVLITEDFYMILEVDQTATTEAINRSYRRLALKRHPDRNADRDTTAAFQLLGEAYETLKDESKRRAYDILYPSIRRRHTSPKTSCPPPASGPQPETHSEASEIAKLEKSKKDRRARWWARKQTFECAIFEKQREIRRLEQEIKKLDDITNAEVEAESWNKSWSAWLLSPIYKKAQVSDEENERKERQKQERRIEKDMKERRLYSEKEDLKKQETLMTNGEAEIDSADRVDDYNISSLQRKIYAKEARAREAREKVRREEATKARKRQQEQWEKQQREAAEEAARVRKREQEEREKRQRESEEQMRRFQAELDAAARIRQAEQERMWSRIYDEGETYFSAASACAHDGWWPKVQGRKACPTCSETWTYLLECPGCEMKACPKCQAAIRPRRRNRRW
ncbi:DnaJ domain-containing protein [Xylaria arbuscula]|nr:DnaJ domain-containing protein [Xylaria arbuscula]